VITVDIPAAQCRTQMRAAVEMRMRGAIGAAPKDKTAADAFYADGPPFDGSALEHRVPVVLRDTHHAAFYRRFWHSLRQ